LMARAEWVDTVVTMRPFWFVRTFAGMSMDVGMSLLVYNFMRTAMSAAPFGELPRLGSGRQAESPARP
jgi:cytochrome c oxidase cbb3-type subunit 1